VPQAACGCTSAPIAGAWMAYVYDSTAAGWACCNRSDALADIRHVVPMLHSGRRAPANSSAKSLQRQTQNSALLPC
jgi:hypothetical protein